ncbi:uncharacterized protein A4U43_C04F34780 [Asparagus officinalis]|uniref:Uncharacterized protein n=1 Tax=Asparagus officinalis TaxID=4686 RepID=A0A5P1FAS1_ASPOF|nr:uncharacterized protein LOC109839620 [Asparagus officinalis]ONK73741.1 uncharacterized protein A4U43_C04F34780 [Asparagus officinalis]
MDLIAKPFALMGLVVSAGVRSVSLVTATWWNFVRGVVDFHVGLCWRGLVWIVVFASLPVKIVTALHRERALEVQLQELQIQFENVIWENKDLEQRLQRAIKERKVIETIFEEIEEDHEKALSRIDQLEYELQDLKEENSRLNEIHGKSPWDYRSRSTRRLVLCSEGIPVGHSTNIGHPSTGAAAYKGIGTDPEDILIQGDSWGDIVKSKSQEQSAFNRPPLTPYTTQNLSRDVIVDEILERRRVVALSRSLFSSILSFIVGMIIYEADDPCMPLVAALFTVVGMSLNSVVQFFSTIKNKPASDAVALLSVNWFILGTLTSPALPSVARVLAPRVIRLADRLFIWLGFSF